MWSFQSFYFSKDALELCLQIYLDNFSFQLHYFLLVQVWWNNFFLIIADPHCLNLMSRSVLDSSSLWLQLPFPLSWLLNLVFSVWKIAVPGVKLPTRMLSKELHWGACLFLLSYLRFLLLSFFLHSPLLVVALSRGFHNTFKFLPTDPVSFPFKIR